MPAPSDTTIKKLFAVSSNRCAFPGCPNHLVDASGALIGRVCHIRADRPGGKRYDPKQSDAERQGFANLIILCANHHIVIDDDDATYTVAVLEDMKRQHEQKATKPFVVDDKIVRQVLQLMAAAAVGAALSGTARDLSDFARALAQALWRPNARKTPAKDPAKELLGDIEEILRYGPKGRIAFYAEDVAHKQLGSFFSEVFKKAGWRAITSGPKRVRFADDVGPVLLLQFLVRDEHQIPNVRQTVLEVLSRCGFDPIDSTSPDKYKSEHNSLLVVSHFGLFR